MQMDTLLQLMSTNQHINSGNYFVVQPSRSKLYTGASPCSYQTFPGNILQLCDHLSTVISLIELRPFAVGVAGAGEGALAIDITHGGVMIPAQIMLDPQRSGEYNVRFVPQGSGYYTIRIFFAEVEVAGQYIKTVYL